MNEIELRDELRAGISEDLGRRRKIIALSTLGLVDFSIISLYQTGIIKRLPDIPLPVFDSNKVNAAKDAYMMGVPDGPVSATVYGLTMVLAAAMGSESTGRKPVLDVLLGGAIAGNAAGAVFYMYDMIFKQKKICLYCVTGALINFASAIIIAPVVIKGIKKLLG